MINGRISAAPKHAEAFREAGKLIDAMMAKGLNKIEVLGMIRVVERILEKSVEGDIGQAVSGGRMQGEQR